MAQDLSSIRDLVRDEQAIVLLATVALHDGETSHHFVTDEGHVAITVKTHKHGAPITALLPGGGDGGTGQWWIPEIGTEVAIGFDGDYEGDAFVLQIYGSAPPSQMAEAKVVIVGTEVHVVAPNGVALPLPTKADVAKIGSAIAGAVIVATDGGASLKATILAGVASSLHGTSGTDTWPVGTLVLKGQ